jgi:signal transduction histidine kinase
MARRTIIETHGLTKVYRMGAIEVWALRGVALLLSVPLSRALTRPLRELTAAARALAGGDLGHQVPVRSHDELGELAKAFNRMSADLARAHSLRRQMTADVAHELRTPLSLILGHTEALCDGVLPPHPRRWHWCTTSLGASRGWWTTCVPYPCPMPANSCCSADPSIPTSSSRG